MSKNANSVRIIRLKIKFDMASMAACLGIPKSTYQRYEDGSAKPPPAVQRAAQELLQINETFINEMSARISAHGGMNNKH